MAIKLIPKFAEIFDLNSARYTVYALSGGRGSGKSYSVCQSVLWAGSSVKKKIVCLREVQETLRKSLYTEFITKIDDEFHLYGWEYNKSDIWNNKTGSSITFSGMADRNTSSLEALKGFSAVDIYIIDEAQSISKAALDYFMPLLGRKKGCIALLLFNRTQRRLPIWEVLNLDNPAPYIYYLETTYLDNPYIDDIFIQIAEQLKINKPEEYDCYYLNKPNDALINLVTKHFTEANIVDLNYFDTETLHISCDFNVDPMSWVIAHKTEQTVLFIDEIVLENTNTKQTMKEFLSRYGNHKGKIIINGDASGDARHTDSDYSNYAIMLNMLREHFKGKEIDVDIRRNNPRIKNRVNAWNQMIFSDDGERFIYIDPKCKWLIFNCETLKYKEGTSSIETPSHTQIKGSRELKFLGHIFDAASYIIEYYFPVIENIITEETKPYVFVDKFWEKMKRKAD